MTTAEFIQKRIEGKEKEIEKLNKKIERIKKAQSTNWEVNPYYYHEDDLKWALKGLEAAQLALDKYRNDLQTTIEKDNSRNVQVIIDFLEAWKENVREFYKEEAIPMWEETLLEYWEASIQHSDTYNNIGRTADKEERKAILDKADKLYNEAKAKHREWDFLSRYCNYNRNTDETVVNWELINKDLNIEANAKYDDIINRTNAIVGEITDASNLTIGNKGDLNGFIIGTKGKAKVHTIGAGGYNIQCYHFRTLVNKM